METRRYRQAGQTSQPEPSELRARVTPGKTTLTSGLTRRADGTAAMELRGEGGGTPSLEKNKSDGAGPAPVPKPGAAPAAKDTKDASKDDKASKPADDKAAAPGGKEPAAKAPGTPGDEKATKKDAPADGSGPAGSGPSTAGQTTAPPPPLTMTSATRATAPSGGGATRLTVGVGEIVTFTGSESGNWTATAGGPPGGGAPAAGTTFEWQAPDVAGTAEIKLTVGSRNITKTMSVIAPNAITMTQKSVDSYPTGTMGAGQLLNIFFNPMNVAFDNLEWLEIPGGPSGVTGYFSGKGWDLNHHPNPNWLGGFTNNKFAGWDHAAFSGYPAPWTAGSFYWTIPNNYRVAGKGGGGHFFANTTQSFRLEGPPNAGRATVTKQGVSVTREAGGPQSGNPGGGGGGGGW